MRRSHHIKLCMHTSDHDSETTFYHRQAGMMHPNQFYGPFESGAPLATLEDMERRMEAVMFGAELTNMIRVHVPVVSAGLRGCGQDLLFEVACSDFATKPIKTVIRISQGNTCVEPGSSPTFMSAVLRHCIHNTEHAFVDGKVTTISRILVLDDFLSLLDFSQRSAVARHGHACYGVDAAASGDSASASASAQPSGEVAFPVVRLVRPTSRHTVHRAMERYRSVKMWRFFVDENISRRRCTLAFVECLPAPPRRDSRRGYAVPVGVQS